MVNDVTTSFKTVDGTAYVDIGKGATVQAVPLDQPSPTPDDWISISIRDKDARYQVFGMLTMKDAEEMIRTLTAYLEIWRADQVAS